MHAVLVDGEAHLDVREHGEELPGGGCRAPDAAWEQHLLRCGHGERCPGAVLDHAVDDQGEEQDVSEGLDAPGQHEEDGREVPRHLDVTPVSARNWLW